MHITFQRDIGTGDGGKDDSQFSSTLGMSADLIPQTFGASLISIFIEYKSS
ncbi:hypothetical protein [Streptococcus suis]|uniref:hypothetical protein n=1 Tax=Streptococcus suis TaxID=1307 RepID=UPI00137A09E5|nr:hypothetical protein [Streptococcus suis]